MMTSDELRNLVDEMIESGDMDPVVGARVHEFSRNFDALTVENERLSKELHEFKGVALHQDASLEELMQIRVEESKQRIALTSERDALRAENERLKAENTSRKATSSVQRFINQGTKVGMEELLAERDALRARVQELENEIHPETKP